MTRRHNAQAARRYEPFQPRRDNPSDSLDAIVDEATERFVRVLVRRGASQRCIQQAFRRAWLRIPRGAAEDGRRASRELVDVGHVMTLWFDDPFYVDARGKRFHCRYAVQRLRWRP